MTKTFPYILKLTYTFTYLMGEIRNSNEIMKYFNCTKMKISHKLHIKNLPNILHKNITKNYIKRFMTYDI